MKSNVIMRTAKCKGRGSQPCYEAQRRKGSYTPYYCWTCMNSTVILVPIEETDNAPNHYY